MSGASRQTHEPRSTDRGPGVAVASPVPTYGSARQPHPVVRELIDLLRYRDFVAQLVVRNIRVRYKRSLLGLAWSMLSPLMTMAVLSLVFTHVFRSTAPNYPLYLFPGLLLWTFFAQTVSTITAEVIGGIDLWKRIYAPRTAFAVATTLTGLVHLAAALVPLAVVMLVVGAPFGVALLSVPFTMCCTALFAIGVGLAVGAVAGHFADVGDLFQVLLNAWLYLTPVIYPRAIIPEAYHWVWRVNPMALLVDAFRMPFYEHAAPSATALAASLFTSIVVAAFGWWMFTRTADALARRG